MMRRRSPLFPGILVLAGLAAQWLAVHAAQAADAAQSAVQPPRVGLVLAGGGARGMAHIGVIRYLEERHIRIDAVAGTSMGSIIGGLYASGMNADQLTEVATTLDWRDAFSDATSRDQLPWRRKQEDFDFLAPMKLRVKDGRARIPMGVVEGQHLNRILHDLVAHVARIEDFDRLPIPYRAVAADIATGDPVVLAKGDLAVAMRASMSIPGFFAPVDLDGKLLVDGGIAKNIPVDVVQGMGVDRLIVVDIGTPLAGRENMDSVLSLVGQLTTIMTRKNSELQISLMQPGDVLIQPPLDEADVQTMSFEKAREAIDIGYRAAAALEPQLAALAQPGNDTGPAVAANLAVEPPRIDRIDIVNDSRVPNELLRNLVHVQPGEVLDKAVIESDVAAIYGLDEFSRVDYAVEEVDGQQVLTLRTTANPGGVSYMKFGLRWDQDSDGDSEFGLRASWRQRGLNRLGGEWYTLAQIGGQSQFLTEWYQPLDIRQRFFIDTMYAFDTRDLYFSEDDRLVARAQQSEHRIEIAPGMSFGNSAGVRIGAFIADGNTDVDIADPSFSSMDTHDAGYFAEFRYDTLDRPYFPGRGIRLQSRYSEGSESWGADAGYDAWRTMGYSAYSFGEQKRDTLTVLGMWSELNADDDTLFTIPSQAHTLGGFLALSGRTRDSLAGNYLGLAELIYYRRLNEQSLLPFDFPVYIGGSLEAGNVWLRDEDASIHDLEYAGSLFLGVDSPIGPVYLGVGAGENNQRALYLQIGKLLD